MRLEPIEKPKGLMMRIAFWMTRRQFGKVMTPMKVVIARMPRSLRLTYEITKFELKGIRLGHELHFMVGTLASQINGCTSAWTSAGRWRSASTSGWRSEKGKVERAIQYLRHGFFAARRFTSVQDLNAQLAAGSSALPTRARCPAIPPAGSSATRSRRSARGCCRCPSMLSSATW